MRISRNPKKRAALSVTSLIDVIFLLLLFFMLTSTFVRHQQVDIAAPNAEGASGGSSPDVLLRAGADDQVTINGETVGLADIADRLAALRQAGGETLLVTATEDAVSQTLVNAVEAAQRSGFTKISVAD
ncbi:ExbD/TolR family protein [Fulvimarina endophytica]|uniref:ExbD/TolR family protein n=1 Tax=Fulvimarina endophytica TaxID=2293836 RepID=UPI0013141756|nr:biopolymer transporter ExbD [Fulvimarina endophytica]